MYKLVITFADHEENGFAKCGAATFTKKSDWNREFNRIQGSPIGKEDPAQLILDKVDSFGSIVDGKFITAETAEEILGMSYKEIIENGRNNTPYTIADLKEMSDSGRLVLDEEIQEIVNRIIG